AFNPMLSAFINSLPIRLHSKKAANTIMH
ncbi:uncharacterized protein METZ01_LOCUS407577, partial [marine metagenome]